MMDSSMSFTLSRKLVVPGLELQCHPRSSGLEIYDQDFIGARSGGNESRPYTGREDLQIMQKVPRGFGNMTNNIPANILSLREGLDRDRRREAH